MDSIKIRILQLSPCNPAPQHRRGDCLARRLTSWPRTTRPLRPSAKLSSGPHSDAPSPASRTTRERPSFFSATAIADAMSRRFALAAAARSWRARPAPRHVHLHSLYASPRSQLTHATPRLAPCSTGQGHCHCRPSPPFVGKVCCRGYASREERAECWDPRFRSGRPILPPQRIAAPAVGGCGSGGPSG